MRVSVEEASSVALALLVQSGASESHAATQVDVLVEAEMRGHPSHGLQRLPRLLKRIERRLADPTRRGRHSWRRSGMLQVDGERGLGPVVGMAAIDALLERVPETGIAVAAVRNANHLGMLALYAERAAQSGRIGIALSSSEALVHPYGGSRAMLGTNPIAIAIPTEREPLVLDLATSAVSMGEIHDHALRGAPLTPGWALDEDGMPTTDAERAKRGAIAPFGAAKGYSLGLAFELLVASLAGSALAPDVGGTLDAERVANKGDVFIVIDAPVDAVMSRTMAPYLDSIRQSPPAVAGQPVLVPGDRARARRAAALRNGISIDDGLWSDLLALQPASAQPLRKVRQ